MSAGGVVFGYRNVPVLGDGGQRSHVLREIREDEAAGRPEYFRHGGTEPGIADDRANAERRGRALPAGSAGSPPLVGTLERPRDPVQPALQGRGRVGTHEEA